MLRRTYWPLLLAGALMPLACANQQPPGVQGISWSHDYQASLAQAREESKPLMVDVFAERCKPCQLLDETVFSRADVGEASEAFVTVKVDGDKQEDLREQLGVTGYPTVLFLAPDGEELGRVKGAVPYQVMLDEMEQALEKLASTEV